MPDEKALEATEEKLQAAAATGSVPTTPPAAEAPPAAETPTPDAPPATPTPADPPVSDVVAPPAEQPPAPPLSRQDAERAAKFNALRSLVAAELAPDDGKLRATNKAIPPDLLQQLAGLLDAIRTMPLPSMEDLAAWVAFYQKVYALVKSFFGSAPVADQVFGNKLHLLSTSLNHDAVMADLTRKFVEHSAAKQAPDDRLLSDVLTAEHKALLTSAHMNEADVLPLVQLARDARNAKVAALNAPPAVDQQQQQA